jgi:NADPH:quinone reductase-like Zn-dependent oxidoreductase
MRAIVQDRYGSLDVLMLRDVAEPSVQDDEVLVRVRAASVHPDVWHVVRGRPYVLRVMGSGVRRPKHRIPGTDLAGRVESVGRSVTRFRPGDEVFGESVKGYSWRNGGAYAEYAAAPQEALAHKPERLTFEQAAAVATSGLIAIAGVRHQGKLQAGQRVLVNGAGGGVGVMAVQLAKALGAASVTAVDSAGKLEMLRSIGADQVVDYAREDFTQRGDRHDLIVDVPGNRPFSECRRALAPDGTYVLIGHDQFGAAGRAWFGSIPRFLGLVVLTPFSKQLPKVDFSMPDKLESMALLHELVEAGKVTPVVDRTFPLSEVAEAIRYMESGAVCGKVVLTV